MHTPLLWEPEDSFISMVFRQQSVYIGSHRVAPYLPYGGHLFRILADLSAPFGVESGPFRVPLSTPFILEIHLEWCWQLAGLIFHPYLNS